VTATVGLRCGCGHVQWRHLAEHGHCRARYCRCVRFLESTPWPSDEEAAVLHRIENTRPAPESYRPDDDDEEPAPMRSGKASIPDHLRTDTVQDYRRAKGEL
jgi:hypothetical protein